MKRKAKSPKKKRLSGAEIAVLALLGAAVLALAGFLVFPKTRWTLGGKKTAAWEARGRFASGRIQRPRDLAMAGGNLAYVTDLDGNAVVPVDLVSGRALGRWPRAGDGSLTEPFGLASRPGGGVAVADTFHESKTGRGRVALFDRAGAFERSVTGAFFGPRDVAMEPDGRMILADTGNHRLVYLDPAGRVVRETGQRGGGRGDFDEPRSLALDRGGVLHVLDMRNRRWVQVGPDGTFLKTARCACIQEDGDVPYLAVSGGGRVAVSCPGSAEIHVFSSSGKLLSVLELAGRAVPYGLAFEDEFTLLVADESSAGLLRISYRDPG